MAEVTGRKYELQINPKTNKALVMTRRRVNTNDAFRQFNNNEVDVLLIGQGLEEIDRPFDDAVEGVRVVARCEQPSTRQEITRARTSVLNWFMSPSCTVCS